MSSPAIGNLYLVFLPGPRAITAPVVPECVAPFTAFLIDAQHADDLCPYTSLADLDAEIGDKYDLVTHNHIGDPHSIGGGGAAAPPYLVQDPTAWNGKQAFHIEGLAGVSYADGSGTGGVGWLEVDQVALSLDEYWVRFGAQFSPGFFSFDPAVDGSSAGSDTFSFLSLGGGFLYYDTLYDFASGTWSRYLHFDNYPAGDTIVYNGEPTWLADGALWEIIGHAKAGNAFVYARRADGSGPVYRLGGGAGDTSYVTMNSGTTIYGPPSGATTPARWNRYHGYEMASGSDPFGILAATGPEPVNLVSEPSFEATAIGSAPVGWTVHAVGTGTSVTGDASHVHGSVGVKLACATFNNSYRVWIAQSVSVQPNTQYTLSASLEIDWDDAGQTTGGAFGVGSQPYIREAITGAIATMNGPRAQWKRIAVTFTTGPSQTTADIEIGRERVDAVNDPTIATWVDAVMLELGPTATGFIP